MRWGFGNYKGNRVWGRREVERGVWVSLGADEADGIVEVTPRKFMPFDLVREGNIIGGFGKQREFDGPFTFDVVLAADTPAGPFRDICRNSRSQSIAKGGKALVTVTWDGEPINA